MKDRIQATYNEATELYGQAKSILDEFNGKPMPQEKQNEVDRLFDAFDAKTAEAKRLERALEADQKVNAPVSRLGAGQSQAKDETPDLAVKAYGRALRGGTRVLTNEELKALRADSDPSGGFIVAPQQVVQELIRMVDDIVLMRRLATVYPLDGAESLGVPSLDSDLSDPEWTSELNTGSEDSVAPFGKRELKPNPLAKRIKLSKKLLRQRSINVEALVRERLGYKFGVAQEKGFLIGTGANQPLGVFTASDMGIPTSRDVVAAGANAITGDDLINTKFALKAAYWGRTSTRWLLHRDVLKAVRKLKDSNNNYLWAPGLGPGGGLTGGVPATLIDVPYEVSEYAPNMIATGLYTAIIGDFKQYWIAEAMSLDIQVVMELYAESNQVGYIGRAEVDGMPVQPEAFARLRQP